jgi:hypothetical protein
MPAPYRDKHFLEMSPREYEAWKEENRQKDLQRPGRDAIEGVYPEEFIVPASRGLKAALTPRQPTRLESLYNQPMPKEALDVQKQFSPGTLDRAGKYMLDKYMQKEARKEAEIKEFYDKYIREKNAPRMREYLRKRRAEAPRKDMERALTDVVTKTEYNNIFGQPESPAQPYKKGGAVKAKKHRGDGIAQRGKTRGRMI